LRVDNLKNSVLKCTRGKSIFKFLIELTDETKVKKIYWEKSEENISIIVQVYKKAYMRTTN